MSSDPVSNNIVVYREHLLYYSETFILTQTEAIRRFKPYYVGTRRVQGIATPPERTIVINQGNRIGQLAEAWYKASGFSRALDNRLRALKPKLLHAHFGADGAMALPVTRRLNLPLVVTFHGYDATMHDHVLLTSRGIRNRRLVTRRPQLIQNGALFIAVSEHIRRNLLARGFPAERVVTHYNGIDVSVFSPVAELSREPLVLFVGRCVEKKGIAHLLRAMQAVQLRVPDAQLVVIGDGPLRPELETLASELRLNCRFLGVQPSEEVRTWMRSAQVFCVPSITASNGDTEGLPTVILEALAIGLPIVTTDSAGNPEAVQHGQTGLVVPEKDEAALASALLCLLEDEALRERLRRAGLEDVHARFDARRLVGHLESLYQEVAENASIQRRLQARTPHTSDVGSP
ncbi:glycosyltransferase [Deinococcus sp.]|uniref:glycosyltransferase n=1 Tax=Deinococcus sp. TaxID=47478 RepID=UPI003B59102D